MSELSQNIYRTGRICTGLTQVLGGKLNRKETSE